jgi:hypothetical protein
VSWPADPAGDAVSEKRDDVRGCASAEKAGRRRLLPVTPPKLQCTSGTIDERRGKESRIGSPAPLPLRSPYRYTRYAISASSPDPASSPDEKREKRGNPAPASRHISPSDGLIDGWMYPCD